MRNSFFTPLLIFLGSLVLFIPFIGSTHLFDWDEINFAECAREMIVSGDYFTVQIDFQPFWEKPPLFIWMQVLAMKIFGVNEFAARFPNALCGATTLAVIYSLGNKISGNSFAWKWVLLYAGSLLPHFYFRSGIIDPWFNLFIILSIYQFSVYTREFSSINSTPLFDRRIFLSGLFLSLAVLTKGPAAILVFGLSFLVYRLIARKPVMLWKHFILYVFAAILPAGLWFLSLAIQGKGQILVDFIVYQIRLFSTEDAGHGHNFFYHWYVLLLGCFPASIFALQGFVKKGNCTPFEGHVLKWMRILFWVVLILFSIVKTKIIHYSSLCYFPLTYIGAHVLLQWESGGIRPLKWVRITLTSIGIILSLLLIVLPFIDSIVPWLIDQGMIKDRFALASFKAGADWYGFEWLPGGLLVVGTLVMVYYFKKDRISPAWKSVTVVTLVVISLASVMIIPRVEQYTQGSAIAFWESKAGSRVHLETLGYKSYAPYFYGQTTPDQKAWEEFRVWLSSRDEYKKNPNLSVEEIRNLKREWMVNGNTDRPSFFVSKNTFEHEVVRWYPHLVKREEKNGFIFWERINPDTVNQ